MKTKILLIILLVFALESPAQTGWKVCPAPVTGRVDDLFMVNTVTGYAVCGDGKILKTTNGGENWNLLLQNTTVHCRSIEFINTQKGFVGGFPIMGNTTNILRRTTDGGASWTDLTALLHPRARQGICGFAVADSNTIYGGGNWYRDSAYIVKSTDGGNTWSFIDMTGYARHIIDLNFTNKDTGFATGTGPAPFRYAVILYTTDGGITWTYKYQGSTPGSYCWKIQRLTKRIYFASIQDLTAEPPKILKSADGGMTWKEYKVSSVPYNIQGVGFIDLLHGWTGGGPGKSFETRDGGRTWDSIAVCPFMNRVFKVNDTMLFASGDRIWKYKGEGIFPPIPAQYYASMACYPNPVRDELTIDIAVAIPTRIRLTLLDASGRHIKEIENADRAKGSYQYYLNTTHLPQGVYYVILMTHEDRGYARIVVSR